MEQIKTIFCNNVTCAKIPAYKKYYIWIYLLVVRGIVFVCCVSIGCQNCYLLMINLLTSWPSGYLIAHVLVGQNNSQINVYGCKLTSSTIVLKYKFHFTDFAWFFTHVPHDAFCTQDPSLDLLRRFGIGLSGGIMASCVNIPFDVAKSRIQGPQPVSGQIKYRTCFRTITVVYREEGLVCFMIYNPLYVCMLTSAIRHFWIKNTRIVLWE